MSQKTLYLPQRSRLTAPSPLRSTAYADHLTLKQNPSEPHPTPTQDQGGGCSPRAGARPLARTPGTRAQIHSGCRARLKLRSFHGSRASLDLQLQPWILGQGPKARPARHPAASRQRQLSPFPASHTPHAGHSSTAQGGFRATTAQPFAIGNGMDESYRSDEMPLLLWQLRRHKVPSALVPPQHQRRRIQSHSCCTETSQ